MPYIRTISPSEATGKLKEIYESGSGPSAARGKVSMIRLIEGQLKEARIGEYTIQCDEAKSRKGGGKAPSEKVQEMLQLIEKGCHTINSLKNPVPVLGKLVHNGQEIALATSAAN